MEHDHICLRSGCEVTCDIVDCKNEEVEECLIMCISCVALNLIDQIEMGMDFDSDK